MDQTMLACNEIEEIEEIIYQEWMKKLEHQYNVLDAVLKEAIKEGVLIEVVLAIYAGGKAGDDIMEAVHFARTEWDI